MKGHILVVGAVMAMACAAIGTADELDTEMIAKLTGLQPEVKNGVATLIGNFSCVFGRAG